MNFPVGFFSTQWHLAAWIVVAAAWGWAIRAADWPRLANSTAFNVWAGGIVVSSLLWSMKAGVQPGLTLHLLGAMAMVLLFGPPLALVALSITLAVVTANGDAGWSAYPLNAVVMVIVPVLVARGVHRLVEARLPHHFFVYVFVTAFFGAALAIGAAGLTSAALLWAAELYPGPHLLSEYLPYYILLAFAEAWLSGMAVTLLVLYRPAWVVTFDDARYLTNK